MIKKRKLTNRLQGTSGGWGALRTVIYDGVSKVYGKEYHQITPIVSRDEWDAIIEWCTTIFGPSGTEDRPGVWSYDERWYANNSKILIKDIKDCEWFLFRWQ
jgi:hypothetical protein